jgi:hypothetical protein
MNERCDLKVNKTRESSEDAPALSLMFNLIGERRSTAQVKQQQRDPPVNSMGNVDAVEHRRMTCADASSHRSVRRQSNLCSTSLRNNHGPNGVTDGSTQHLDVPRMARCTANRRIDFTHLVSCRVTRVTRSSLFDGN